MTGGAEFARSAVSTGGSLSGVVAHATDEIEPEMNGISSSGDTSQFPPGASPNLPKILGFNGCDSLTEEQSLGQAPGHLAIHGFRGTSFGV